MIIKSVTKDGTAIPLSPEEAVLPAVKIAVSTLNNSEFVFWLKDKSVAVDSFSSHPKDNGEYVALVEGTCKIGKTRVRDDRFFVERPHRFKLQFCSCKDAIGAPHLNADSFEVEELERDPTSMVGEYSTENETVATGELAIQSTKQSVGGKQYNQSQRRR